MGLNTPFLPENIGSPIYDFGFFKVQRQAKSVIVEILKNFFTDRVQMYKLQMPDIIEVQNSDAITKINISRDFPWNERKLPLIIVAQKGSRERKLYLGADNLSGYKVVGTSTGQTAREIYHGAADIDIVMIILAQSPDERSRLSELIAMCFTHYYRWQYYYTYDDGNMFTIIPNNELLDFGNDSEATESSKTSLIYITNINMKSYVEYTFSGLDITGTIKDYTIDPASGPIQIEGDYSI